MIDAMESGQLRVEQYALGRRGPAVAEETTRINLVVGSDIPDCLTHLAGGERRRGEYVTRLIRSMQAGESSVRPSSATSEAETLQLAIVGLLARLKHTEERLAAVEHRSDAMDRTVAALIAKTSA